MSSMRGATARKTPADARVARAIDLLVFLTAQEGCSSTRAAACEALSTDEPGLRETLDIVTSLGDRLTGARAVIVEEGDSLALIGDAARMKPLRLSLEEGMVLGHVLSAVHLAPEARERAERSLAPLGVVPEQDVIADTAAYGPHYLTLSEAIRCGARCTLLYRSSSDERARERTVDPGYLQTDRGTAYLVAWDVDQDAQRRYRLDRVEDASLTDDSATRHPWRYDTPAESLSEDGERVTLGFSTEAGALARPWLEPGTVTDADVEGRMRAEARCASKPWLFDQVLAGGGSIWIVEPATLRQELLSYAESLLAHVER